MESKWFPRMTAILIALVVFGVTLFIGEQAFGTPAGDDGEHKVSICHRTASDTNPYVFITVDEASLSPGHLDNDDPGHKPKYWKSDGTWRGVDHVEGDPKDDYLAQSEADCQDTEVPPEDVEIRAAVSFTDPTCNRDARVVADSSEEGVTYYTTGDEQPGGTVTVTAVADEGYVLVGKTEWTHTFDSLKGKCKPDKPTKPEKPTVDKPKPPGDLAETGMEGWIVLAAIVLAGAGTVALRAARYRKS
jgi:hypothetical protein